MTSRERFVRTLTGREVDRVPFIKVFGGTNAVLPRWEEECPGISRSIDELLRFERTLSALWKAILEAGATGDFRPSPTNMCNWCDYKPLCPAFGGTLPEYPGWPATVPDGTR